MKTLKDLIRQNLKEIHEWLASGNYMENEYDPYRTMEQMMRIYLKEACKQMAKEIMVEEEEYRMLPTGKTWNDCRDQLQQNITNFLNNKHNES